MKRRTTGGDRSTQEADELLAEILVDAHGDDEELGALCQALEEAGLPADGFVVGEPVAVTAIEYDGNPRRGLTARCRRAGGDEHVVGLADVRFAEAAHGERHLAAYRSWLGLEPLPSGPARASRSRAHQASEADIDLERPVELVVLAVKEKAARCRLATGARAITLRASGLWKLAPGHVVTVRPRKHWRYAGHAYLSGEIVDTRVDVPALGLAPLRLRDLGEWDPAQHYWGEVDEPVEEWAVPIIAAGPRPEFEMEQVLPGDDPADPDSDPILLSNDLSGRGDVEQARAILTDMLQADLRCLDAHSQLGHLVFGTSPSEAVQHYEVGFRIGESSIGPDFDGVLPWAAIDNRPFLRCMQGYALCLWRLQRHDEAAALFERMLWLNPTDNQGVRFLVDEVRAGESWRDG